MIVRRKLAIVFIAMITAISGVFVVVTQGRAARSGGGAGTLTIAYPYQPNTMDPAVGGQTIQFQIAMNVFDTLVWMLPNGKLTPDLATHWKISNRGKTYTFFLRKGVKFQDGTPFDSAAVVAEYRRVLAPATHSQSAIAALGPFKSANSKGRYSVVIHLKTPYAPLLTNLAQPPLAIPSPAAVKKYGASFGEHVVGTGPFKLSSWTKGSSMTLVRNPAYSWAPAALHHRGPAKIAKIVYDFVEAGQARVDELQSGQAQLMDTTPGLFFKQFRANPAYHTMAVSLGGTGEYAFINNSRWPTNQLAVRQAIMYSINRPGVIKLADNGVYPEVSGPLQRGMLGYDDSKFKSMYSYNPGKAAAILRRAGWKMSGGTWTKNGKQLSLLVTAIPVEDLTNLAQAIQGYLQKAGMKVTLQQMAEPAWNSAWLHGQENMSTTWLSGFDPDILRESWTPSQPFDWSKYSNKRVTKLLNQAEVTGNRGLRARLYVHVEQILMAQAAAVPLHENDDLVTMSKNLRGVKVSAGDLVFTDASIR